MNRRSIRFQECETCAAKPGIPELCAGCVHNRASIAYLTASKYSRKQLRKIAYWVGHKAGRATGRIQGYYIGVALYTLLALAIVTIVNL